MLGTAKDEEPHSPHRANQATSSFRPGTTFEQIVDLCRFDADLRQFVREDLQFTSSFPAALRSPWSTMRTAWFCKRLWRACASDRAVHGHAYLDRRRRDRYAAGLSGTEYERADAPQAAAVFLAGVVERVFAGNDSEFMPNRLGVFLAG